MEELRTVHIPYWRDKTLTAVWAKQVPYPKKLVSSGVADCVNYLGNHGSHFIPDYDTLLKTGYKGYRDLAVECLARVDPTKPEDIGKTDFYEGIIEVLDAIRTLAENYAAKAREMAVQESRDQRKKELLEMPKGWTGFPGIPRGTSARRFKRCGSPRCSSVWRDPAQV
jgi:formate C-acetyltransferase